MSDITYHIASAGDVDILVENRILFAIELSGTQEPGAVETLRRNMRAYFSGSISQGTSLSVIARCGAEVAGIGSVHYREMPGNFRNPSGKWGYIMNMYTLKKFRRRGVCKGVLNMLVHESQKKGFTAFELHATPEGEMVYRQFGFFIHDQPTYRLIL